MNIISCIINFKDNIAESSIEYTELLKQMSAVQNAGPAHICIDEHSACASEEYPPITKVCEGYQFSIVFDGFLSETEPLKKELKALGYSFLTQSDAELALNCYIHFGDRCPEKLDGSYCFVIYDSMRQQVFASCDFFASRPLFYSTHADDVLISSRIRGILAHPGITPKINAGSLRELLSLPSHCSGNIFDGVYRLAPSHYMKIKNNTVSVSEYTLPPEKFKMQDITDISQSRSGGMIYLPCSACDAMYSLAPEHCRLYSADSDTFTSDTLKKGLYASVNAYDLPLLSENDFIIPHILENTKKERLLTAFPFCDISSEYSNFGDILIKNNAFHKAVLHTLDYSGSISFPHDFLSAVPAMCQAADCVPEMPFLSRGLYEQLSVLPYTPSAFFAALCRKKPPVPQQYPMYPLLLHIASRELLKIISDGESPVNAFFNPSALLKLCEGKFDFTGTDISALAVITYILKLNIWFSEYRPALI